MLLRSRFRRLSAVLAGIAMLLGVGLVTGLVASPAAAVNAQHSTAAGKGVTKPRPVPGHASPAVGSAAINHGGPVQTAPRVYLDFWGWNNDPYGEAAYLQNFLNKVGGTPWLDTVNQYSGAGAVAPLAGSWSHAATVPQVPTDADIQAEASAAVAHFGLSTSDINVQIMVATPTAHSTAGFGTSYCAYHGVIGTTSNTHINLPYIPLAGSACGSGSVNPTVPFDGVSIVEGHELAETTPTRCSTPGSTPTATRSPTAAPGPTSAIST